MSSATSGAVALSAPSIFDVFFAALITALATGLGALPFLFSSAREGKTLNYANAITSGMMIGCALILTIEGLKEDPRIVTSMVSSSASPSASPSTGGLLDLVTVSSELLTSLAATAATAAAASANANAAAAPDNAASTSIVNAALADRVSVAAAAAAAAATAASSTAAAAPAPAGATTTQSLWLSSVALYVIIGLILGVLMVVASQKLLGGEHGHGKNHNNNNHKQKQKHEHALSSGSAAMTTIDAAYTKAGDVSSSSERQGGASDKTKLHVKTFAPSSSPSSSSLSSSSSSSLSSLKPQKGKANGHVNGKSSSAKTTTASLVSPQSSLPTTEDVGHTYTHAISPIHDDSQEEEEDEVPAVLQLSKLGFADRRAVLIMLVMLAHSFAEGVSLGVSWARSSSLGSFVSASLALHNVPEGLAVSVVMLRGGASVSTAALWSIISSLPQPITAVPAFLFVRTFQLLLPIGMGFAAGAMIYLPLAELLPEACETLPSSRVYVMAAVVCVLTLYIGVDAHELLALLKPPWPAG